MDAAPLFSRAERRAEVRRLVGAVDAQAFHDKTPGEGGRIAGEIKRALPTANVLILTEHITTIFSKIGAANKAEAVAIAFRKHLLKP